jgi:hypothetical protein
MKIDKVQTPKALKVRHICVIRTMINVPEQSISSMQRMRGAGEITTMVFVNEQ